MTKKGIYAIPTTFVFILIMLIVALGIIYYSVVISSVNSSVDQNMNKYVIARNFRDSIYFCYGSILDEEFLDKALCKSSTQDKNITIYINKDLIKGFRIIKTNASGCTPKEWNGTYIHELDGKYRDRFVYSVPILENKTFTCFGRMEVEV